VLALCDSSPSATAHVAKRQLNAQFAALAALALGSWAVAAAAAAAQDAPKPERGEQIMNAACSTCHDLRPIDTQALDDAGWTKEVKSMVEQGAEVKPEEAPVLVEYLSRLHGPLPDGPGKEVLLNICTRCHDLQRVRRQRNTAEGWLETLDAMLNDGAPLTEKDLPVLLRYLSRNFGPAPR
jgi:cytochrome c5